MSDVQIVEGLTVKPGDTLIVRVDPDRVYSAEEVVTFKAHVERALPDVTVVVVLADQIARVDP